MLVIVVGVVVLVVHGLHLVHQMVNTRQTAASGSGTPAPGVNEQPAAG